MSYQGRMFYSDQLNEAQPKAFHAFAIWEAKTNHHV